jgi:magnesium chelatase subunit D
MPLTIADDRLLGGCDLTASLGAGRVVAQRGLLAEAHGGIVLVAGAERLSAEVAGRVGAAMDAGAVRIAREGVDVVHPAQLGVVALDEGASDEERPPAALLDRLALHVGLEGAGLRDCRSGDPGEAARAAGARARMADPPAIGSALMEALCGAAQAVGVSSLRAVRLAARAAQGAAAWRGRDEVALEDCELAARLVLAGRARHAPAAAPEPAPAPPSAPPEGEAADSAPPGDGSMEPAEIVVEAVRAALPADILKPPEPTAAGRSPGGARGVGRARSPLRGRPLGARAGPLRSGARLDLVATLRAAAPWQGLRRASGSGRIVVQGDDFRIRRFVRPVETTTIVVVDASGSAAFQRLAEAKGAVEVLLADAYAARVRVGLIAFRGQGAEVLLSPTRSLARARRRLAGLPGGGGTPLAAGIDAARDLAAAERAKGRTPFVLFLTDGRANIARDGQPGREAADADAIASARSLRAGRTAAVWIDTSPRPRPDGDRIAREMGAAYAPLPMADPDSLARRVRALTDA